MRKQHDGWLYLLLCLFFLAFLSAGQGETQEANPTHPLLSKGRSKQGLPLVRIGVVPALTITETIKQYQPIVDYLNRRLNINAQLIPQKDYATVLEKMKSKEIDAGIMGSLICYRSIKEIGAVPLVRPEKDGDSTYEGLVFVRKDSKIKDIYALKGKVFVYVDRDTSAGYVYLRYLLKEKGYDADKFFKEAVFAGKHDAAILMVLNKKAVGGAVKDDVYFKLEREDPRIKSEMKILHLSKLKFPDRTIAVRNDFDKALSEKIKDALINMDRDEEGRKILNASNFDRYIPAEIKDFRNLEEMLK